MSDPTLLTYRTDGPVDPALAARLVEQAGQLCSQHDWWSGSLRFDKDAAGGPLTGSTSLLLGGYRAAAGERVEVDGEDDAFMAWMDLCVIVDWLCDRSEEHGLTWHLTYLGAPIGSIRDGQEDDEIAVLIAEIGSVVGAGFDERDDRRAEALDDRHRARSG